MSEEAEEEASFCESELSKEQHVEVKTKAVKVFDILVTCSKLFYAGFVMLLSKILEQTKKFKAVILFWGFFLLIFYRMTN